MESNNYKHNPIRFWRLERGLTQKDLVAAMDHSLPRWKLQLAEQGVAILKDSDAQKIRQILGVPLMDLKCLLITQPDEDEWGL